MATNFDELPKDELKSQVVESECAGTLSQLGMVAVTDEEVMNTPSERSMHNDDQEIISTSRAPEKLVCF